MNSNAVYLGRSIKPVLAKQAGGSLPVASWAVHPSQDSTPRHPLLDLYVYEEEVRVVKDSLELSMSEIELDSNHRTTGQWFIFHAGVSIATIRKWHSTVFDQAHGTNNDSIAA